MEGESSINIDQSVSNNANFKALWGSPYVENAVENTNYITSTNALTDWFTVEQAFRAGSSKRVTVSPLLQLMALKSGSRTQTYKYFIDRNRLESKEFIDLEYGGLSSKIIKDIHYYGLNNEDNDVHESNPIVLESIDRIDNINNSFVLPDNVRWNIIFGAEILRDLNNPDNEELLNLGNPFLQLGRDIVPSIRDYISEHRVPYFYRQNKTDPDPFTCCGPRWFKYLKSARNVNFKGAKLNGREWESEDTYLPDAVESYSTRLYPAMFSGSPSEFLDLSGANFEDADLRNVVFRYCNLTNVTFKNAFLHDAIFLDNIYGNTNFDGVQAFVLGIDQTGPQQYGPTKRKKSTGGVYFVNTSNFSYDRDNMAWKVDDISIWPDGKQDDQEKTRDLSASFVGADIRGSRFANLKLEGDFSNIAANWIELENVEFKPTKLHNSAFKNLYIDNESIKIFELDDGDKKGVELFPVGTPPVFLRREDTVSDPTPFIMVKYGSTVLNGQDFTNTLEGKNLYKIKTITGVNFSDSLMNEVDFSGVTLLNCDFTDCSMNQTNFHKTKLHGCKLNDCDLIGSSFVECDFGEATINNVYYSPSTFGGSDFTDAVIANCQIKGAKFREIMPPNKRRTILKDTSIYWDQFAGQELLGYNPSLLANKNLFKVIMKMKVVIISMLGLMV